MPFLETLGMNAAEQAVSGTLNGAMGAIFGRGQNRRQYHQQKRLQGLQIRGQKELTDYNMLKQLEMFDKTGYEAQVKQLEKAGLNAGLLYGMGGGAGGSTNVSTGDVSGGNAQKGDSSFVSSGMGVQLALLEAQRKNIEADTEVKLQERKKKWEETQELDMSNLIQEYLLANDEHGNFIEDGKVPGTAAAKSALEDIRRKIMDNNMIHDENKRREAINSEEIKKLQNEINLLKSKNLSEREILNNLIKDGKLKEAEIEWNKIGLTKETFGQVVLQLLKRAISK